jgi:hypothetical protein
VERASRTSKEGRAARAVHSIVPSQNQTTSQVKDSFYKPKVQRTSTHNPIMQPNELLLIARVSAELSNGIE